MRQGTYHEIIAPPNSDLDRSNSKWGKKGHVAINSTTSSGQNGYPTDRNADERSQDLVNPNTILMIITGIIMIISLILIAKCFCKSKKKNSQKNGGQENKTWFWGHTFRANTNSKTKQGPQTINKMTKENV